MVRIQAKSGDDGTIGLQAHSEINISSACRIASQIESRELISSRSLSRTSASGIAFLTSRRLAIVSSRFRGSFGTCVVLNGLHIGELLALQWRYVDFEAGTIKVEQSLCCDQIAAPKTTDNVGTVPYGEVLAEIVANHKRKSQHAEPEDYIFCKGGGDCFNPDVLRKDVLCPILDRLQIPRPKKSAGFYSFRHSAASLINRETGNLKLALKLLGHSNLSTTADLYTHTSTEAQREASEVLERAVFGNLLPIVPKTGNRNS